MTSTTPLLPCPFCGDGPCVEERGELIRISCQDEDCPTVEVSDSDLVSAAKFWNRRASAQQAQGSASLAPHKTMTPEEYEAMPIIGWHAVCRNIDGFGGTGVRFMGEADGMPRPEDERDDPFTHEFLMAALRKSVELLQWQPIDTAPKDGCTILGWWSKSQVLATVYWDSLNGWEGSDGVNAPTHWLEIPQPPSWTSEVALSSEHGKDAT